MIQAQTILLSPTTPAPRAVMCFKVLGGSGKKYASIGDEVICSVKTAEPNGNVKKARKDPWRHRSHLYNLNRPDGSSIKFDTNSLVIVDEEKNPRGTRIFGPVARELRAKGYSKIVSLAVEVV